MKLRSWLSVLGSSAQALACTALCGQEWQAIPPALCDVDVNCQKFGGYGGADSGKDVSLDTTPDDGAAESDSWDAWSSDPEHWDFASWNPSGCSVLQAKDPVAALPPYLWLDCANGVSNCVYLDTHLIAGSTVYYARLGTEFDVRRFSGSVYFALGIFLSTEDTAAAIYSLDSGPLAAWKSASPSTPCQMGTIRFGRDAGAAVRVSHDVKTDLIARIAYGSFVALAEGTSAFVDMDKSITQNPLAVTTRVEFSSQAMAFELLNNRIYVWDYGAGTPEEIPRPDSDSDDDAIVIGDDVVFVRDSGIPTNRFFSARHPDGSIENLYGKPQVWKAFLKSDLIDFVWQELDEVSGTLELWTAPVATTAASFTPKKVRTIEGTTTFVLAGFTGEGWWVYKKDDATLRAVRLADGYTLDVPPPKGYGWTQPAGVVDGEVWATFHKPGGQPVNVESIARVPIGSLGMPKP